MAPADRSPSDDYRRRVDALNRRIADFNLKTPVPGTQRLPLNA
jgi:hypothetical protein